MIPLDESSGRSACERMMEPSSLAGASSWMKRPDTRAYVCSTRTGDIVGSLSPNCGATVAVGKVRLASLTIGTVRTLLRLRWEEGGRLVFLVYATIYAGRNRAGKGSVSYSFGYAERMEILESKDRMEVKRKRTHCHRGLPKGLDAMVVYDCERGKKMHRH